MIGNDTCRLENIGKYAIPICGHDVITNFMVRDLKTKPTNGILLYGGLYANESEDRFFWYASTIRSFTLKKIPSMVDEGARVREYLMEVMRGNRIHTLYRAFERPFAAEPEDNDVEVLVNLGLLTRTENGSVRTTEKGIELCCVLAHLTVNHRVKPPPQQLNEFFESIVRAGYNLEQLQENPDTLLNVDSVMEKLSECKELEHLRKIGMEPQNIRDVVQLYLCPPF
jgi:hypothetical protein